MEESKYMKNWDFVQLYRKEGISALRSLIHAQPTAAGVYLYLISEMDTANGYLCTLKDIAGAIGVNPSTVTRAVQFLSDNQYILKFKRGSSFLIILDPSVVWRSNAVWRDKAKDRFNSGLSIPYSVENIKVLMDKDTMLSIDNP